MNKLIFILCSIVSVNAHSFFGLPSGGSKIKPAPVPRLISRAYFSDWGGTEHKSSPAMSTSNWEISTSGVNNGDLLILIANIDNGENTIWPNPISAGFTQLIQQKFGNDGQTLSVSWKFANNEPATYSGGFMTSSYNYGNTIALIAFTGARFSDPVKTSYFHFPPDPNGPSPVTSINPGVTPGARNCTQLWLSITDWSDEGGTVAFTSPVGFTQLTAFTDRGTNDKDWVSMQVAYRTQANGNPTGIVSATDTAAGRNGIGNSGLMAICP